MGGSNLVLNSALFRSFFSAAQPSNTSSPSTSLKLCNDKDVEGAQSKRCTLSLTERLPCANCHSLITEHFTEAR